ncbi:HDL070Wp [Eremothecium sinecaudum]|uniref:HDL070Wp n=1 Tax=Eremothecium sinecaudum TaxID=45286 RepID=A0A0X8HSK2_9SACH|nr:HDL070Wp [Eremothecium sinecaudum]AMD20674.1 HDL070Wp [Eremothecium sinecaudum]
MGQLKPIHYDQQTVRQLSHEIIIASCVGALYGAAISISTALLMRRYSSVYRNVKNQVRVFYHCSWISMGAVFNADKQVVRFQGKYYANEMKRRERILDEAAERGIFLEEDDVVLSTAGKN